MDLRAILIGIFPISLKCYTISLTLPYFFQVKRDGGKLSRGRERTFTSKEKHSQRVITIDPSEGSRAQKVMLKKPTMEMTRHIRSLYVRAPSNGKPVSNVMPLRMLRALGRGIGNLIETEVSVSAFTREISKTLGVLPIDITMGSKTSLSGFFVIHSLLTIMLC